MAWCCCCEDRNIEKLSNDQSGYHHPNQNMHGMSDPNYRCVHVLIDWIMQVRFSQSIDFSLRITKLCTQEWFFVQPPLLLFQPLSNFLGGYSKSHLLYVWLGGGQGAPKPSENQPPKPGGQTPKLQPISAPSITIEELREATDNFGPKALIGEGSYGRVYYANLQDGRAAAIKKLDASTQPDQEFLTQVGDDLLTAI